MSSDPWWFVITPNYPTLIPILDDGTGPTEWGADVLEVQAPTCKAAIAEGVRRMLRGETGNDYFHGHGWCLQQRDDNLSPYAGVYAERAWCRHHIDAALCGDPSDVCPSCAYEEAALVRSGYWDE